MSQVAFVGVASGDDGSLGNSSIVATSPANNRQDFLDIAIVTGFRITGGGVPTLSMGAGWLERATATFTAFGGLDLRMSVWYRAGVTVQNETITADAASGFGYDRLVYRGQRRNSPLSVAPLILSIGTSSTTHTLSSITTDAANARVVYLVGGVTAITTWTPPGNALERSDHNAACTADALAPNRGATGAATFVCAVSNAICYTVLAINPEMPRQKINNTMRQALAQRGRRYRVMLNPKGWF